MLPLHAAVLFDAPLLLIKELVTMHPNALQEQDHEGKLPLHYAAIFSSKGQQDVMSHMLKYYPEAMWIKASCGRTAIEYSRNEELQAAERIRMRKILKLSENSTDDVYQENLFGASADNGIDDKENERHVTNAVAGQKRSDPADAHRDMTAGSKSQKESETYKQQIQKATMSVRAIQRKLMKKKPQVPNQMKGSCESCDTSNGGESNETVQDEESSFILKCSTDVEEVDQTGQRTVYLNFAACDEDTNDNDSLSEPRSSNETPGIVDILADLGNSEETPKKKTGKSKTDATAKHNYSKKRITSVLQAASSMKSIKRQKVSGSKNL